MKLSTFLAAAIALAVAVHAAPQAIPNTNAASAAQDGPVEAKTLSLAGGVLTNATCQPETLPSSFFRVPEGRSQTEVCAEFTSKCGVLGDGDAQVMSTSCGYNQLHKYIIEGSCIMAHKHGKTWSYARNVSDGMNLDLVYSKLNKNCTELPMSPGWCHDETYNAEAPELCVPASK